MADITNINFEIDLAKKRKIQKQALEDNTTLSEIMRKLINYYLAGKIKLA